MRSTLAACLILILVNVSRAEFKFGIDVMRDDKFAMLAGKRVGVVSNPASVDSNLTSTVDLFKKAKGFKLVALFGPEHGIYGDQYAGDKIDDLKDPDTGLPIYSLYGKTRKPTTQMIKPLDVLVLDLQDIGSRSYTYISTMHNAMEACAEHGVELIILDRPNPLGGHRIEGAMLEKGNESFVGLIPVPYVHGMTMGELAQFVRAKFFPNYDMLHIVKMQGWTREMLWSDTGREWIPTSPHIPTAKACAGYAATGILGELYVINIGVGYPSPFEMVGAPWINGEALASALPKQSGIVCRPVHFKPFYSTYKGEKCEGVQIHMDAKKAENLVEINYQLIGMLNPPMLFRLADRQAKQEAEVAARAYEKKNKKPATRPVKFDSRSRMFDKVTGTDEARKWLQDGKSLDALFTKWRKECAEFREARQPYLLY